MYDLTLILICILFFISIILSAAFVLLLYIVNDTKFIFKDHDQSKDDLL